MLAWAQVVSKTIEIRAYSRDYKEPSEDYTTPNARHMTQLIRDYYRLRTEAVVVGLSRS